MDATTLIPAALVLAGVLLWWHGSIRALDRARDLARRFCERQQWQLLDQTVSLRGVRPTRGPRGLHLLRTWHFEFSADKTHRMRGGVVTVGDRPTRIWADGPDGRVIEDF